MLEIPVLMLFDLIKIPLSVDIYFRGAGEGGRRGGVHLILVWCKAFLGGTGLFV